MATSTRGFFTLGEIDAVSKLLGELKANQERFLDEMSDMKKDIKTLNQWRWWVLGFAAAAVAVAEVIKGLLKA